MKHLKYMKRLIIIVACMVAMVQSKAQQTPLYSQYMHNPFILNPAVAGTYNYFQNQVKFAFTVDRFPPMPL